MKKTTEKINKTKSWLVEKINKIDKPLARLIKKKKGGRGLKSIKLQMKKKLHSLYNVKRNTKDCEILCSYYKQLHTNKMDNLEEMGKFLERYNLPRLNHEETENMNRPITSTKIETVVKTLPTNISPG